MRSTVRSCEGNDSLIPRNPSPRPLPGPAALLAAVALVICSLSPGEARAQTEPTLDRSRPAAPGEPTEVEVSMYLVDLFEISSAAQTIHADIVVVAAWHDPRLAGRWPTSHAVGLDKVWHPRLQVLNQRQLDRSMDTDVEIQPDGTIIHRQRLTGTFTALLDLREFPLDRQSISVRVVAAGYTSQEVRLTSGQQLSGRREELSVSDWSIGPARAEEADLTVPPDGRTLSGVALVFSASRHTGYYLVQLLLPLVAIVMMSWTVFWVDPSVIPTRMSVVVTTMLTLIAYRFMVGSLVPKLSYLTRLDWFLLGATILVLLALVMVSVTSYLIGREGRAAADRIDRWSRVGFPVALVVLLLVVWLR
jgi:hypothetical protein